MNKRFIISLVAFVGLIWLRPVYVCGQGQVPKPTTDPSSGFLSGFNEIKSFSDINELYRKAISFWRQNWPRYWQYLKTKLAKFLPILENEFNKRKQIFKIEFPKKLAELKKEILRFLAPKIPI
jgi:hypothetical protein